MIAIQLKLEADVGGGDERRAQLQRSIALSMLQGVAGLVAGDADGGDRGPVVDVGRERPSCGLSGCSDPTACLGSIRS